MKTIPIRLRFEFEVHEKQHCRKHRKEMNASSCLEYVSMASRFLLKPMSDSILECIRANGDCLRYDLISEEFGIVSGEGFLRTYFKAHPMIHNFSNNRAYFEATCGE